MDQEKKMLTRIMKPKDDRDAGFTLIELLVVVAIIGILAAIAIPVFLNQRASARDASVKADINGIAKVMETVYTDKGYYPTDPAGTGQVVFGTAMTDNNAVTSPGNFIGVTVATGGTSFGIYGCNAESTKGWYYNSATGGLKTNSAVLAATACTTLGAAPGTVRPPSYAATAPFTPAS
jgi:type IV pilus assembly protein PilA